jgi:hypothetical protein
MKNTWRVPGFLSRGLFALALLAAWPAVAQPTASPPNQPSPNQPPLWPHTIAIEGATVTVYQPQAISWPDQKRLTARAALAITPPGAKEPALGTIEVSYETTVDQDRRLVFLSAPQLLDTHFPSLDTGQAARLEAHIRAALPQVSTRPVPLTTVLASLKQPAPVQSTAVNNDPPDIFHAEAPASLVVFDGEPVAAPVGNSGLSAAVNTNWPVFVDQAGTWYLLDNGIWLSASAASGPYRPATALPESFRAVAADPSFADELRGTIPPKPASPKTVPTVFVTTKPAEIIVFQGPPRFEPIQGTGLEYVANTTSDLFLYPSTGRFYYLVSGRWFASPGLDGPWQFATPDLPPDFSLIPPNSPKGHVLASVPGTAAAQQAVLEAQLPVQGTLKRDSAKLDVAYAGAPSFAPVPGTELTYAVNTAYPVIKAGNEYYACYQGAWFVAPSPTGPWVVAASVPPAIYAIPPSSPLYPVTYVKVYAATPETVTFGYTAGYALGFVTAGVLAYGTGYYYPPVVVPGHVPVYYPYPYTYGGGAYYNPTTGSWARGGAVYGPYGGAGAVAAYNPATGAYAHGSAAWGPYGGTAHASFYNPTTGVAGSTTQNANAYGRWGSSQVSGPNKTVDTASASDARGSAGAFTSSTGAEGAGVHGAHGNNAAVVKGSGGDVYAGADGNVYKHTDSGWQKYDNGSWNNVQRPATPSASGTTHPPPSSSYSQLEQDRQARSLGTQQREGAWHGAAPYGERPAGGFGAARTGGGWRR